MNMKDLRQELIDYQMSQPSSLVDSLKKLVAEKKVDEYLKSRNLAHSESQSIRQNEQAKEVCNEKYFNPSVNLDGNKTMFKIPEK